MARVQNGLETLRKNFNRLSMVHERYTRRQTTDGFAIASTRTQRGQVQVKKRNVAVEFCYGPLLAVFSIAAALKSVYLELSCVAYLSSLYALVHEFVCFLL